MSVATKLGGFALVLALLFGSAAFAGSRIDVRPGKPSAERADGSGMGEMARDAGHGGDAKTAPQPIRGLAISDARNLFSSAAPGVGDPCGGIAPTPSFLTTRSQVAASAPESVKFTLSSASGAPAGSGLRVL